MTDTHRHPLDNAPPPKLLHLRGDELRQALHDRHEANKAEWLKNREPARRPLLSLFRGAR